MRADLRTWEAESQQVDDLPNLLAPLRPPPSTPYWDMWTIPLDDHTPTALYAASDQALGQWLLESGGSGPMARYSFITGPPQWLLWHRAGQTYLRVGEQQARGWAGDPFAAVSALAAQMTPPDPPALPTPFPAGMVGYFGYDLRHWVEHLTRGPADLLIPDCVLSGVDRVLTVDHQQGTLVGLVWGEAASPGAARQYWQPIVARAAALPAPPPAPPIQAACVGRTATPARYQAAVMTVLDAIEAGTIYQANISQRFAVPVAGDPWVLYQRLRHSNPAPFAAYGPLGEATIVSASPERFLQVEGQRVITRPIKGTRPRGATPAADAALAAQLRASPKDQAENVMIVDLMRNDLGRVCVPGSVRVPELLALESYATVHHLVSTVTGLLAPGQDRVALLRACWPGGSITGAPKIRAMEIINALEPVTRTIYCGSIGYLSVTGPMDTSIVIRTALVQDGTAYLWAGGGIVAESQPAAEYAETLDKAAALLRALGVDPAELDR